MTGWDILVVDDEPNMQEVTGLALARMSFEGIPLTLHYASSAQSAKDLFESLPSVSVVLLDVVMEHESSGLELISHVRERLKNPFVRFILRTGQAGVAPESVVIQNYDIQEYLNKGDLTVKRLRNAVISALRSYASLVRMERRREISDFILLQSRKLQDEAIDDSQFLDMIAKGIISVFSDSRYSMPYEADASDRFSYLIVGGCDGATSDLQIIKATGAYESWKGLSPDDVPDADVKTALLSVQDADEPISITQDGDDLKLLLTFHQPEFARSALFLTGPAESIDPTYLMTLASHAQSIFEVKAAHWRTQRSYAASALQLAGIVELRLGGQEDRMERMSRQVRLLALSAGCSPREAQRLGQASALHDIGKIKIPDAILMKPGPLTLEQWTVIRNHPELGHSLLSGSQVDELQLGALIALEHHERWDGAGYPNGVAGDAISLGARLTSIIDVHDRLISDRPYRKALSHLEAIDFMRQNAGIQFDPVLISRFFDIYEHLMQPLGKELKLAS